MAFKNSCWKYGNYYTIFGVLKTTKMQNTNNLKCVSTNEQIRNAMTETKLSSTLSVDEKITKLTAIKAEYLISLERRGYKFKTLKPLKEL